MSGRSALGSVGAVAFAALVPKCPFCVAAALSAFGLGASVAASVAPIVRPTALVIAAIAIAMFVITAWRARSRRRCCRG